MEKIKSVSKPRMGGIIETYSFNTEMRVGDIPTFVDILSSAGIRLRNFRLSNSEREDEQFFRTFSNLREFNEYTWDEGYLIDDFGVNCIYNGIGFNLTFNFDTGHVVTVTKGNINLEPMLIQMEQACQKR